MPTMHATGKVLAIGLRVIAGFTAVWLLLATLWAMSLYAISTMLISGIALMIAVLLPAGRLTANKAVTNGVLTLLVLGFVLQIGWWVQAVTNRIDYPQLGGFVGMHYVILGFVTISFLGMIALVLWLRYTASRTASA